MEALHEVVVGELKHPSQQIVKGKRTKRQRPSSPIPFTVATAHLSSGEGVGYSNNEDNNATGENNNNDNNDINRNNGTNLRLSLGGSSEDANSTTTEDEDVARLLILLSQGSSREASIKNDDLDHNYYSPSTKFTSKKYIETSSHTSEKSGMFVYECKTCNRTFSSFQALGGHRASHKKPKNIAIEEIKKRPVSSVFSCDYDYDFNPSSRNNSYSNFTSNNSTTSNKIHECSYCGAEFTSGQALGGHMRRHRGSNGNNNSVYRYYYKNNIQNIQPLLSLKGPLPVNEAPEGVNKHEIDNHNNHALALSLYLDLNLPAPPTAENEQKNQESTKFEFDTEKISPKSPEKPNEQQQCDNNSSELSCPTNRPNIVGL